MVALAAGCGGEGSGSGAKGGGGRLSIATGGKGGVYFVYGAAPRHLTITVEEGTWP